MKTGSSGFVLIAALTTLVLGACGGDDSSTASSESSEATSSVETGASGAEGVDPTGSTESDYAAEYAVGECVLLVGGSTVADTTCPSADDELGDELGSDTYVIDELLDGKVTCEPLEGQSTRAQFYGGAEDTTYCLSLAQP